MRIKFVPSILSVLLLFVVGLSAQIKSLKKGQYDVALSEARKKSEVLLRREITETVTYIGNKVDTVQTVTQEIFPDRDFRWDLVLRKGSEVVDKTKLMILGKYEFRKEGDSEWKKRCIKDCSKDDPPMGNPMRFTAIEYPKVEEYLVSDAMLQDKPTTVYVFYRVNQMESYLNFNESKTWTGADGLIIRNESLSSDIFPTVRKSLTVTTYAYDPKDIAPLEAPIK